MKINKRTVHFFELGISTVSLDSNIPSPPQINLDQLIPALMPHVKNGMEIKDGKLPIEVTQYNWDSKTGVLALLLNKPDPERSDVAYRKRNSKSRRLGNKAPDEDIEVSSHILIKIPENSTNAPMLVTMGAGISPAKIVAFFNAIYSSIKNNSAIKQLRNIPLPTGTLSATGKQQTYEVNHRFSFNALPNGLLSDIIRNGKVIGLNLIDNGIQAFDSSTNIKVNQIAMHIDLQSQSVTVPLIKRILNLAKDEHELNIDRLRIEYIDQGDDTNQIKNKTFDPARIEEAFTRSETISLEFIHPDHQTVISKEIIGKMQSLI
jgi:hypothetical protein